MGHQHILRFIAICAFVLGLGCELAAKSAQTRTYHFPPCYRVDLSVKNWVVTPDDLTHLSITSSGADDVTIAHPASGLTFELKLNYNLPLLEHILKKAQNEHPEIPHAIRKFGFTSISKTSVVEEWNNARFGYCVKKYDHGIWQAFSFKTTSKPTPYMFISTPLEGVEARIVMTSEFTPKRLRCLYTFLESLVLIKPSEIDNIAALPRGNNSPVQALNENEKKRINAKWNANWHDFGLDTSVVLNNYHGFLNWEFELINYRQFSFQKYHDAFQKFVTLSYTPDEILDFLYGYNPAENELAWLAGTDPYFNWKEILIQHYDILTNNPYPHEDEYEIAKFIGPNHDYAIRVIYGDTVNVFQRFKRNPDGIWKLHADIISDSDTGEDRQTINPPEKKRKPVRPILEFAGVNTNVCVARFPPDNSQTDVRGFKLNEIWLFSDDLNEAPTYFTHPASIDNFEIQVSSSLIPAAPALLERITKATTLVHYYKDVNFENLEYLRLNIHKCGKFKSQYQLRNNHVPVSMRVYQSPVLCGDINKNGSDDYFQVYVSEGKILHAEAFEKTSVGLVSIGITENMLHQINIHPFILKSIEISQNADLSGHAIYCDIPHYTPEERDAEYTPDKVNSYVAEDSGQKTRKDDNYYVSFPDENAQLLSDSLGIIHYLDTHIKWDRIHDEPGKTALMRIKFAVDVHGQLTDIHPTWETTNQNDVLKEELLRLKPEIQNWKPGRDGDTLQNVNSYLDVYLGYYMTYP